MIELFFLFAFEIGVHRDTKGEIMEKKKKLKTKRAVKNNDIWNTLLKRN